jgi:predicted small secreted protein
MAGVGRGINGTHVASPRIKIMNTSPKQLLRLALAAALLTLLGSGCRTVKGFGQDVEHAGSHIEESAR